MIDIQFYMKIHDFKKKMMKGRTYDKEYLFEELERCRSKEPIVYNIETTNACNMKCEMCPRTTMMSRSINNLDADVYSNIISQIRPFSAEEWQNWQIFVEQKYGIDRDDMSENHFFLHIIPKVIVLHGYGDPLLDKIIAARIEKLSEKGIYSYFSCNPANINLEKSFTMFERGLSYIKYSIESVDDFLHKKIRGDASNFSESYQKILELLNKKEKNNYKTRIVITMLDLRRIDQKEEFEKLKNAFEGYDVYLYLKSQDQQWYQDKNEGTGSIHWQEFCQFPWSSLTVKSNGEIAMCVEDFNNEIILGDAKGEQLCDIWNGERYIQFRKQHFELTSGIKCTKQCDMKLVGNYLN